MATAVLADGTTVEYTPDVIGEGAMKRGHFTADQSSFIGFYKDLSTASDPNRRARLEAILGNYNPTTGHNGDYFKEIFCWPTGIVVQPNLGIITPRYPDNYFFSTGKLTGKEKESNWFVKPKLQSLVAQEERGNWLNYLKICIRLARAIRRLHQAGLAHSDLSNKNVLIDPSSGQCLVIDIDSLVVPGLYAPDVLGTRGYIAPEVLSTFHLPGNDPKKNHPCAATDQHALAVLIYQYLLKRHPLEGPKTYPANSAEEQERLEMGSKALFIEHPTDKSNQPQDLTVPFTTLGPHLTNLFEKAFVHGLHAPSQRPAAIEWERGLTKTWDLLLPCSNSYCPSGWFILSDKTNICCPFCGSKPRGTIPFLTLRKESLSGHWTVDSHLAIYHNISLFKWHVMDNIFPGESVDRTPQAYCVFHQGQWLLINQNLPDLSSPGGNLVPPGNAIKLEDGVQFRLSHQPHGRMAEVKILNT